MCDSCNWQEVLDDLEDMEGDDRFDFALDTLDGIYEWVEENEHVTEAQKNAIENIRESGKR